MLDKIKAVYNKLPKGNLKFLKKLPNRLLFGKSYIDYKNKISTQHAFISANILDALNYSCVHTEYGKNYIKSVVTENEALDFLKSIPLINTSDLSENLDNYTSKEYTNLNSYTTTTGGTGRAPTTIRLSNKSFGIEWAHIHFIWSQINYKKSKSLKLTLRGKHIKGNRLTEYNPLYNEIVVDTFRLNKQNFKQFLGEIKKYKIEFIHGYPSLIEEFMEYCIVNNYKPISIKGVMLGSEQITQEQWDKFKVFFNCKIAGWYGQSEKVVLAYSTVSPNEYKILTSYGYASIHNPDSTGFGEIIGTTFVNKAMPLINYRTGDYGRIETRGNEMFLKDIQGRWGKDYVYLRRDKRIPTTSINIHSSIQKEILFYQIHQTEYARLEIRIIAKTTTKLSSSEIIKVFQKSMDTNLREFTINYKIVSDQEIIRSKRGKKIMLVQELSV